MGGSVARLTDAREKRLLERLGALYETMEVTETVVAVTAKAIDETLRELDEMRLEAAGLPLPVTVAAEGTR